jgi:tripartite motif-containing protein 71
VDEGPRGNSGSSNHAVRLRARPPAGAPRPPARVGSGNGKSFLPWGIATDPTTGNLYVTEVGNDRVQEFSPAGAFIATFGTSGQGAGQLSNPRGVAVGSTGKIYVADTANNRIEEWVP